MITPQEITDKVFVKAVFGGYDMNGVDAFLEAVCADYTALYKENAILKGKLKVLVEKVEEYRSTEDAMRMALLTAQRMGEEITAEANKHREETLRQVETEAKTKLAEAAKKIADEEIKLNIAAKETAKFIELSQAIMRKHSEFLTKLETARRTISTDTAYAGETAPAAASKPAPDSIDNVAEMIGNAVEKITSDGAQNTKVFTRGEQAQIHEHDKEGAQIKLYADDAEDDSVTPRPKFDFDDLKFGSNFNIDE